MCRETGTQFCFFLLLAIEWGVVSFTFWPSYSWRHLDKTLYGSPVRHTCSQSVYRPNVTGSSKNLFPLAPFTSALSMASSHRNLPPPEVAPVCCLSYAILDASEGWLLYLLYITIYTFVKLLLLWKGVYLCIVSVWEDCGSYQKAVLHFSAVCFACRCVCIQPISGFHIIPLLLHLSTKLIMAPNTLIINHDSVAICQMLCSQTSK